MATDTQYLRLKYLLILMWPPAQWRIKLGKSISNMPNVTMDNFTIHGLWPAYYNSKKKLITPKNPHPKYESVDISEIERDHELHEGMKKYWPNFEEPSRPIIFWENQWKSHGSAPQPRTLKFTKLGYFRTTVQLRKEVDILDMLVRSGIEPDAGPVEAQNIVTAIQEATNYTPILQCLGSSTKYLYQVYLCYDENFEMINSEKQYRNCDATSLVHLESIP